MNAMMGKVRASMRKGNRGATMVEYGLMVALIAIFLTAVVVVMRTNLGGVFQDIADKLKNGQ